MTSSAIHLNLSPVYSLESELYYCTFAQLANITHRTTPAGVESTLRTSSYSFVHPQWCSAAVKLFPFCCETILIQLWKLPAFPRRHDDCTHSNFERAAPVPPLRTQTLSQQWVSLVALSWWTRAGDNDETCTQLCLVHHQRATVPQWTRLSLGLPLIEQRIVSESEFG